VLSGKSAQLSWQPPHDRRVTGYRLTLRPLNEPEEAIVRHLNLSADEPQPLVLRDLLPGGQYEVQLQTVNGRKHSEHFLSTNFTTKPNVPGKSPLHFRFVRGSSASPTVTLFLSLPWTCNRSIHRLVS
jgi:hypothetical protein